MSGQIKDTAQFYIFPKVQVTCQIVQCINIAHIHTSALWLTFVITISMVTTSVVISVITIFQSD